MSRFLHLWLIALVVKTALAIWLPLSNDEAYYWVWGHHPQLSYFDHPPMVGWIFWLGKHLDFLGHASRVPGVWLGHLTLLIWHRILSPFLNKQSEHLWLVFVLFSPFLGLGSLIVTPDIPFLFFWSLSLLLLLQVLKKKRFADYFLFGASLGLGFLSKYLIVIFVPISLLWLAFSGEWKKVLWRYVPVTILAGLLFCMPVLYWNYQNEWASFAFQLDHGLVSQKKDLRWPLEYLGAQILILFPTVIWMALRRQEPRGTSFLHFFGWLPIAFFFYTSFKARVEANWPIMAHPAILSLAFLNMQSLMNWKWLKITISIWGIALLVVLSQVIWPWIPMDPKKLKTNEFTKFDVVAAAIKDEPEVYLGSYQMASAVSYRLNRQVYKLNGLNRRDFYDFTPHSQPRGDRFILVAEIGHPLPAWIAQEGYEVANENKLNDEFVMFEVVRRAKDLDR